MKKMKRLAALFLAVVMVLAMGMTAMAQEIGTETDGTASITIKNASKGEKYTVYKLFDASVTGTTGGSISYTLMEGKTNAGDYFVVENGYVKAKDTTNEAALKTDAFKAWARSYGVKVHDAVEANDGSELVFHGLDYGYYFIDSSQGANVTVDSTNPDAEIYDKNSKTPTPDDKGLKTVSGNDVSIGDTVTYTIAFNTTNYIGEGAAAKKVISYTINDTLPNFLSDVKVTSIKIIDKDGKTELDDVTKQFNAEGKITIDWVKETVTAEGATKNDSLYNNQAKIVITYTAIVTDKAATAGDGNTNRVTVEWTTEGNTTPESSKLEGSATIKTYAIALKKVDDKGTVLKGAEFSIAGLTVKGTDGNYVVTTADDTNKVEGNLKCDGNGELVIRGVASGKYTVTEEVAPKGYNKLADPFDVTAETTSEKETHTTKYLNEKGEVINTETSTRVIYENTNLAASAAFVVNKTGAVLPSTGGIGTTIFYVVGGIMVLGAGVLLITKKRMSAK